MRPAASWNSAKLAKARAMGALLLSDMRSLPTCAASSLQILRQAERGGEKANSKDGFGEIAERAVAVRVAASSAIAFFRVRRASGMAQLLTLDRRASEMSQSCQTCVRDVLADRNSGPENVKVARRKRCRAGMDQSAYLVAVPTRGNAYPVHIIDEWILFRG